MLRTLSALILVSAASLSAQSTLPDGPGKATTVRVCTSCHGAEMFSGIRKSKAEWEHTVSAMTTERGVEISDADFATVLKYLATNLGRATSDKAQAALTKLPTSPAPPDIPKPALPKP